MKQIIVIMATIVLGIMVFNMIAGNGEESIFSSLKTVWSNELSLKTRTP